MIILSNNTKKNHKIHPKIIAQTYHSHIQVLPDCNNLILTNFEKSLSNRLDPRDLTAENDL